MKSAEEWAELFHKTYERLAPTFGYETKAESQTSWEELPNANKSLMEATVGIVGLCIEREAAGEMRQRIIDQLLKPCDCHSLDPGGDFIGCDRCKDLRLEVKRDVEDFKLAFPLPGD